MKNRVKVTIGGDPYTIVAEDNENYIRTVAQMVDDKMNGILTSPSISVLAAAVLTAVNFADEYQKAVEAADNMRAQMKSYLEDASRLRAELNDARREIARLGGDR